MCRDLLGIGINSMRNFKTVHVSVVFEDAADSGIDRLSAEGEDAEDEENHGQGCPITQVANVPALAPSAEKPSGEAVEKVMAKKDF